MSKFQVGDIVTGIKDSLYEPLDENGKYTVVRVYESDIAMQIKVLEHKNINLVGKTFAVMPEYYELVKTIEVSKDVLVLLVGPSGSGKTTLAKMLEAEGFNVIKSYTTREPREAEEWGHTFVDKVTINHGEMIAYKQLYGDSYWATKAQYKGKGTSIYVVDPDGAGQVISNVKDAKVITIFLRVDEDTRRVRMLSDENRRGTLIVDRIRADFKIFEVCKCDYAIDANQYPLRVLNIICKIIEEEEKKI